MNEPQTTAEPPPRTTLHIDDEWELQRQCDRLQKLVDVLANKRVFDVDNRLNRRAVRQANGLRVSLQSLLTKART